MKYLKFIFFVLLDLALLPFAIVIACIVLAVVLMVLPLMVRLDGEGLYESTIIGMLREMFR